MVYAIKATWDLPHPGTARACDVGQVVFVAGYPTLPRWERRLARLMRRLGEFGVEPSTTKLSRERKNLTTEPKWTLWL